MYPHPQVGDSISAEVPRKHTAMNRRDTHERKSTSKFEGARAERAQ
jgi:hypothetical protein